MPTKYGSSRARRQEPKSSRVHIVGPGECVLPSKSGLGTGVEVGRLVWRPRKHDDSPGPRDDWQGRRVRDAIAGLLARGIPLAEYKLKKQRQYVRAYLNE